MREAARKSWVLGALVAVGSWNVVFVSPATGNDASWVVGLYLAAEQGLLFGQELIFTYGPLGFLSPLSPSSGGVAVTADGGLSQLAFLYGAAIHVLLCFSLVWALGRTFNPAVAAALAFLLVAAFPAIQRPYVLAAIWCLALVSEAPPPPARRLVIIGGGALAAVESLVRLGSGPAILAMCAIAIVAQDARRRDLAALLGTYAGVLATLWFAAGQAIGNVPDFIAGGFQIVSGYSQAMASAPPGTKWDLAVVAGVLAVALLVAGSALSVDGSRRRVAAALIMGVAAFAAFKEGIVREDAPHLSILFATALALAVAIPWQRTRRPPAVAALVALAALALATASPSPRARDFNPIEHADTLVSELRTLASAERRDRLAASGRELIAHFSSLDQATLRLIGERPVHVDPSGASVAWAYDLDWRPLPVFQANSAYTTALDQDNVDFLTSPQGPDRVLRGTPAALDPFSPEVIDGRYAAWNPPGVAIAMLCRFRPLRTTPRWQVLARADDRCGDARPLGSVETAYGERVEVPAAMEDEAVIAEIHGAGVAGTERLQALLFRARFRFVKINGGAASYRLVPGTAADGLIMSVPPVLDFPAPFSLSPGARTLELTGASGELRVEFFALPLRVGPGR